MQYKLVQATLAHPIDRMRGGRGVVSLNCVYARGQERVSVTGVAYFDKDDDASLTAARDAYGAARRRCG